LDADDQPPAIRLRGQLVAQVPQETGNAGMHADGVGATKDEPSVRRPGHDSERCSADRDDQAVCIGLDRAGDLPKA
jgi:hypothetical protein